MQTQQAINEESLKELEKELEFQKHRFVQATESTASKVQEVLTVENWIRDYPVQTAIFMALGGFISAQLFYRPETGNLPGSGDFS